MFAYEEAEVRIRLRAWKRSRRRGTRRGARPGLARVAAPADQPVAEDRRPGRRSPSARSTNCSMSSTVTPSSRACASDSNTRSTISGASPSDISSAMSSFGGAASTRARASICCSPPDSVPACWRRRSARTGNISIARSNASLRCAARDREPQLRPEVVASPRGAGRGCATRARRRGPACDACATTSR